MTPYAFFIEAYQKSGKKNLFIVKDAKNESRAERDVLNILDDNNISVGRGSDYKNPVRTNYPVFDDLPKDGVLDDTWCDRNMLAEDGLTWQKIPKAEAASTNIQEDHAATTQQSSSEVTIKNATFNQRVLAGWLFGAFAAEDLLIQSQLIEITTLQHDMDATYAQNLLLALNNAKDLLQLQHCYPETLFDLIDSIKSIWSSEGKAPDVGNLVTFSKEWINAHNNQSSSPNGPFREDITARWISKQGMKRTDAGTNAGGGKVSDRNSDYDHTLDTMDVEIALATLPFDFDIYNLPGPVYRRAKEIVAKKEEPFRTWSAKLRAMPGILDVSRAGIIALIRGVPSDITHFPDSMQRRINSTLTADYYTAPTPALLALARHTLITPNTPENVEKHWADAEEALANPANTDPQPEIKNVGNGMFSVDGLMNESQPTTQTKSLSIVDIARQQAAEKTLDEANQSSSDAPSDEGGKQEENGVGNVQMEAADGQQIETGVAVSQDEKTDAGTTLSETVEEAAAGLADAIKRWTADTPENSDKTAESGEPAVSDEPPYFEPGRYEGLSNNDYHSANGISSTQVKDARISLMYYHGRHITRTIRRDSSDALTFGSLVHTLALEPEKLEEEYAVFPGVPAGAFTNTDTLKAWIREYNADKPKPEQLKLTGKKEELQEAIRIVNPSAIFADEFESQWRASVSDKTILTAEQLQAATAIQQALFNHPTAGKLLQHTARAVEVSYFGMDEGTGLEVRVRPDLELELDGLRIAADVKTISLGKVKQDNLRAKLHREIIDRDYHVSAAMYSEVADFDQFFWIFVNKDEGYHWVAVIEASTDLLELGSLEYHRTMRDLANAYDTDTWPAPVTTDYTDELNDFDLRRLEALRMA